MIQNNTIITLDRAIVVKVALADAFPDMRRVTLCAGQPLEFNEFRTTFVQLFPQTANQEHRLLWTDTEGDQITLAGHDDLQEALSYCGGNLRLTVFPVEAPSEVLPEPSEGWFGAWLGGKGGRGKGGGKGCGPMKGRPLVRALTKFGLLSPSTAASTIDAARQGNTTAQQKILDSLEQAEREGTASEPLCPRKKTLIKLLRHLGSGDLKAFRSSVQEVFQRRGGPAAAAAAACGPHTHRAGKGGKGKGGKGRPLAKCLSRLSGMDHTEACKVIDAAERQEEQAAAQIAAALEGVEPISSFSESSGSEADPCGDDQKFRFKSRMMKKAHELLGMLASGDIRGFRELRMEMKSVCRGGKGKGKGNGKGKGKGHHHHRAHHHHHDMEAMEDVEDVEEPQGQGPFRMAW